MSGLLYASGHFPFCQTDFTDHPPDELEDVTTDGFPVQSTLQEFGQWVWQTRTWRIQMSGTASYVQTYYADYTEPDPPYTYSNGPWTNSASVSLDLDVTTDPQFDADDGRKLVCTSAWIIGSGSGSGTTFVTDTFPPVAGGYDASYSYNAEASPSAGMPRWKFNAALTSLFPRLEVSGQVTIGSVSVASWSTLFQEEDPGSGNHYEDGEITFAGHTIPIQIIWNDYFGEVVTTFSMSLSIEPEDVYLY